MPLSKEEIKQLAEELKPSILESTSKVVDDKLSKDTPKIVQDLTDTREFLIKKVTEHGSDLPKSLQRQFSTLVNTTITALSNTPNQVTRDNIDTVLKQIKEANFDKELIDRERASENAQASADGSQKTDENKDDPDTGDGDKQSKNEDTQDGSGVRTQDGTQIEMDKTKKVSADGNGTEEVDVLTQYPLSNNEVYLEARKQKFINSKSTGKGETAAELVKNIDLNKFKSVQQ